jgi:hypothetical protein
MGKTEKVATLAVILILICAILQPQIIHAQIVADHTRTGEIPVSAVTLAKSTLHIAYGHTSHGSQLVTGMDALMSHDPLYSFSEGGAGGALDLHDYAMDGDVGYYPQWYNNTLAYLGDPVPATGRGANHPLVNVVIWSWCGQASWYSSQQITDQYLAPMSQLESTYPGIKFVYMTGHLDGSGVDGDLNQRNNQIRAYVQANNKILFDFADIESYDPSGSEFLSKYANDNCDYNYNYISGNWAAQWVTAHPSSDLTQMANTICTDCCAHSQNLNCVLKGRAIWWLWARIAGWTGNDNVRIVDTPYTTLSDAYLHAGDGSTLKARAITFDEDLDLGRDIGVTIQGGYDDDFQDPGGYTTQDGKLTVSTGALTVDRLVMK